MYRLMRLWSIISIVIINNYMKMRNLIKIALTSMLLLFSVEGMTQAQAFPMDSVREGDICPDITLKDTAMVDHTLREYRGKYIYIDVWASWCSPCRKETPFLHQLEKELKGKNIVFIGVCVDTMDFRFRGSVSTTLGYYTGLQWWDKSKAFEQAFRVDRIPRFLLIDPNGKVIRYQMSRPSNPETLAYLKNLLR